MTKIRYSISFLAKTYFRAITKSSIIVDELFARDDAKYKNENNVEDKSKEEFFDQDFQSVKLMILNISSN